MKSAAQSGASTTGAVPSFLTRLERVWDGEDVCALVNRTGEYRLERRFPAETRVYVGSLSTSELQELSAILDTDELRNISQ